MTLAHEELTLPEHMSSTPVFSLVPVDQSIILFYFIMVFLPLLAYLYFSYRIF
jgi:hypothetical protein